MQCVYVPDILAGVSHLDCTLTGEAGCNEILRPPCVRLG